MRAQVTQRKSPGISGAATNSTAPWPATRNPMLTRSNRITRRCWRKSPKVKFGSLARTIDDRSGVSTWNRVLFGRRRGTCDDFTLQNLEFACHRAVHRALSRDLDQARPLDCIQVPLQCNLLDDSLDFLAYQLAVDLFGDDHTLVVGADRHAIDRPVLAPGIKQDRQYSAVPEGCQQELIGIRSQPVATRIDRFVADERQVSGIDAGLVGRPRHVRYGHRSHERPFLHAVRALFV